MNVYVESNFVLEQALEQEQCESCKELIGIASSGSIRLVVPAFSLAEPHIALMRRGNEPVEAECRTSEAPFRAWTIEDLPRGVGQLQ